LIPWLHKYGIKKNLNQNQSLLSKSPSPPIIDYQLSLELFVSKYSSKVSLGAGPFPVNSKEVSIVGFPTNYFVATKTIAVYLNFVIFYFKYLIVFIPF
jgi:hypothetical protein